MKIALIILLAVSASFGQSTDINDVFAALNKERQDHGLPPLLYKSDKQQLCDAWAERISENLIHNNSDNYLGEAIGEYFVSDLIIPLFMDSQAHRRILMNRRAKYACVAIYYVPENTIVRGSSVEFIPGIYYTVIRTY